MMLLDLQRKVASLRSWREAVPYGILQEGLYDKRWYPISVSSIDGSISMR